MQAKEEHTVRIAAGIVAAVVTGLAGLHVYWAQGGERGISAALGGHDIPPPVVIWAVAALLAGMALAVLGRAGVWGRRLPAALFTRGTWATAAAFALAGIVNLAGRTALERWGFAPLCLAMAAAVAGIAHAQAGRRPDGLGAGLGEWLPSFCVREHHSRMVDGPPEEALAAALALPAAPDWIVRSLFRLRGMGAGRESIAEFSSQGGFIALDQTATAYVFGTAVRLRGQPRVALDRDAWLAWRAPGVKIAANFRAEDAGGGRSLVTTETRVQALDRGSHALFHLYWLVVSPFSRLIRRRWLRALAAQQPASTRASA